MNYAHVNTDLAEFASNHEPVVATFEIFEGNTIVAESTRFANVLEGAIGDDLLLDFNATFETLTCAGDANMVVADTALRTGSSVPTVTGYDLPASSTVNDWRTAPAPRHARPEFGLLLQNAELGFPGCNRGLAKGGLGTSSEAALCRYGDDIARFGTVPDDIRSSGNRRCGG